MSNALPPMFMLMAGMLSGSVDLIQVKKRRVHRTISIVYNVKDLYL